MGERTQRVERLLELLVTLLGAPEPLSLERLAERFPAYRATRGAEAGRKAFERDKAELLALGVPLRCVPDAGDGAPAYCIDRSVYALDVRLAPDELAALTLAAAAAAGTPGLPYAAECRLALARLALQAGVPCRPPPGLLVHLPASRSAPEVLAELETAVRRRKRVTCSYRDANGRSTRRTLDPWAIFYRRGAWYLAARCHLRDELRVFRVDRIQKVTIAAGARPDFERPRDFDAAAVARRSPWTFEVERPVAVTLAITAEARQVADEDFGAEARREVTDDGAVVRFVSGNPAYVVWRVLTAGGHLRVLAPAALRARVREAALAAAARHAGAPAGEAGA